MCYWLVTGRDSGIVHGDSHVCKKPEALFARLASAYVQD